MRSERDLSTILHCLQWYTLVLRTRTYHAVVELDQHAPKLVLQELYKFSQKRCEIYNVPDTISRWDFNVSPRSLSPFLLISPCVPFLPLILL